MALQLQRRSPSRRWIGEHRMQNQRWSEDQKFEQQPAPSFGQRREAAARKFRQGMDSAIHEIAAQLDEFPWHRLRMLIAEQLDARGIALDVSSASATEVPTPQSEGV